MAERPEIYVGPWMVHGGYRIARWFWEYVCSPSVEGWAENYTFLSPTVYETQGACEAAIAAGDYGTCPS